MLDDVNMLLLTEYKKPNILTFSIQPKNKHHLILFCAYEKNTINIINPYVVP